jgi:hypothetical protein
MQFGNSSIFWPICFFPFSAGTCGMGRVVDNQLRVIGTSRLRVMDNSIQPEIVTTNTQASAFLIGEKGSSMILQYWAQQRNQGGYDLSSGKSTPNEPFWIKLNSIKK